MCSFQGSSRSSFRSGNSIQRSVSSLGAHLKNLPALLDIVNIRLAESLLENSHSLSSWAFRGYYESLNDRLCAVLALSQTCVEVPCATTAYFGRAISVVDKLKYYCHRLVWFEGIWEKPHLINADVGAISYYNSRLSNFNTLLCCRSGNFRCLSGFLTGFGLAGSSISKVSTDLDSSLGSFGGFFVRPFSLIQSIAGGICHTLSCRNQFVSLYRCLSRTFFHQEILENSHADVEKRAKSHYSSSYNHQLISDCSLLPSLKKIHIIVAILLVVRADQTYGIPYCSEWSKNYHQVRSAANTDQHNIMAATACLLAAEARSLDALDLDDGTQAP